MSAPMFLTKADFEALGEPISSSQDASERVYSLLGRAAHSGRLTVDGKVIRGDSFAADSAEIFLTSPIEAMLTAITREPQGTMYMVPGASQLLPIKETVAPGQETIAYEVETPTGQAAFVAPDGMRRLPQVGEFSEKKSHRTDWIGMGYGYGLIEMWRAAQKGGTPIDVSRAVNARNRLNHMAERINLYGDVGHELGGLIRNGQCVTKYLGSDIEAQTDPDEVWKRLQIMEHTFKRAAQSYSGQPDLIVAPNRDRYQMQRLRYGTGSEGPMLWAEALTAFPWLANVVWIDGLETAASNGGALWIFVSKDDTEIWTEMSPSPMLFGPFEDAGGLRVSFSLINHIGGVVNRRPERMVRFEFAA